MHLSICSSYLFFSSHSSIDAGKRECMRMLTPVLIALACVFVTNNGTHHHHHHHIHHSIPVVFSIHLSSSYSLKQVLEGKKHKVFYHYLSIIFF